MVRGYFKTVEKMMKEFAALGQSLRITIQFVNVKQLSGKTASEDFV